jgi:hypothetical protein
MLRGNPLQRRFRNFHETLDNAITDILWNTDASVLVFSDSLFLATTDPDNCFAFCQRLLCESVMKGAPLRIGVGYGAFVVNDFAFESSPRLKVITTQFLGTGVVFATDAEKAIKGMRIALHPTTVTAIGAPKVRSDRRLALPDRERSDRASHEWNYLPLGPGVRESGWTPRFDRHGYVQQLRKMKGEANGDPSVQIHYDATINAVDRMVTQMHHDWLRSGR